MAERLTDDELAALEHQRVWSEDEQRLLLTEVRERRAAAEETEMAMHARIRAEYDSTVADCWRAEGAKKDARIATLEASLRECNQTVIWHTCCPEDARRLSQMRESDERAEMAESRATQAEAQAAEMRDALNNLCGGCRASVRVRLITECGDAGRALLAELEALREVERRTRNRIREAVPEWAPDLREAIAAVDAARRVE